MNGTEQEFQKKLEEIFDAADLQEDDRKLWHGRLDHAGEYVRKMFIDVFGEDRNLLLFFTGNIRKRLAADGDRAKLDEIAEEEKAYFAGLMRGAEE